MSAELASLLGGATLPNLERLAAALGCLPRRFGSAEGHRERVEAAIRYELRAQAMRERMARP